MNNVKVILTVYSEGATLKRDVKATKLVVAGNTAKNKSNAIHNNLVAQEVKQSIKLTKEFYEHSLNYPVQGMYQRVWKQMGKTKKLEAHLDVLCKELKGTHFSYEILED